MALDSIATTAAPSWRITGMHTVLAQNPQQAEQARALQDQLRAAAEQARAAQDEARSAQEQAQRQVEQEMRKARDEIDRAIREATEQRGNASEGTGTQVVFPPFPGGPQVPEGAVIIAVAFFVMCAVIAVGLPIARAFGRRVDRRSAAAPTVDPDTRARLERIEQAVDAIAVEVERISEGQRFTTKIIGDLRGLPHPDPAAAVPDRIALPISRGREPR